MIDRKQEIMDVARAMVQSHGYKAMSFREIAKDVGVKSASVHYHFPTKGDLGAAIARRYTEDGVAYLSALLEKELDAATCIRRYTDIFRSALVNDNRMCLCGVMASEVSDLPAEVQAEVENFTRANLAWLTQVLSIDQTEKASKTAPQRALAIFAAIQGAQLVARGREQVQVFDDILDTYRTAGLLP